MLEDHIWDCSQIIQEMGQARLGLFNLGGFKLGLSQTSSYLIMGMGHA